MDYSEMLVAIEVWKLAEQRHSEEFKEQKASAKAGIDLARWKATNTPITFVPAVLRDLEQVCTAMGKTYLDK
jgi:hypothetical protein